MMPEQTSPSPALSTFRAGMHTRYRRSKLGAVTSLDPATASFGISFLIDEAEHRFLLSRDDGLVMHELLSRYLRLSQGMNDQSLMLSLGSSSSDTNPDEVLK